MRWLAPAMMRGTDASQVKSRVENGFIPIINLHKPWPSPEELARALQEAGAEHALLNMGAAGTGSQDMKDALDMIAYTRRAADTSDIIERTLLAKPSSVLDQNPQPGSLAAPFDTGIARARYDIERSRLASIVGAAANSGLTIRIKNRPMPNYALVRDSLPADPQPRWGGSWSPRAEFFGTMMHSPQEISFALRGIEGVELLLDVERLAHTAEYAGIFNLLRSDRLSLDELSEEERRFVESTIPGQDERLPVYDYTNLDSAERAFLADTGYVFRKGQAPVFTAPLDVRSALDSIFASHTIGHVSPGFQTGRVVHDVREGERIEIIASMMPGIQEQYIHDATARKDVWNRLEKIHSTLGRLMQGYHVTDIEVKPYIGREGAVFQGPEWESSMRLARNQLTELLG